MNVWPKSGQQIRNISRPFDVKHDLHVVGPDEYKHRHVDIDDHKSKDRLPIITTQRLDELANAIAEDVQIKTAVSIRETLIKELLEKDVTHKTFQSVYTPTTPKLTERVVLEEIEGSSNYTSITELKKKTHAYSIQDNDSTSTTNSEQDNVDDIVTPKAPVTLEAGRFSMQLREEHVPIKRRAKSSIVVKTGSCDERECLASALQFYVEDLVDGIIFHESELPDCLIAEECLTDDECASMRKLRDRKDQVRVLLCLIKGRDLRVLRGFMKHVKQHNQDIAAKVLEKFEDNKREGVRQTACFQCQLEKHFNVKHVVDGLWAIQAIDDGLYNTIIYSEAPVGAQETLWEDVIRSINCLDKKKAVLAHNKLLTALTSKNLFIYLANGIRNMLIQNHGRLMCICERRRSSCLVTWTSEESCFPRDSSSDWTSGGSLKSVRITDDPVNKESHSSVKTVSTEIVQDTLTSHPSTTEQENVKSEQEPPVFPMTPSVEQMVGMFERKEL